MHAGCGAVLKYRYTLSVSIIQTYTVVWKSHQGRPQGRPTQEVYVNSFHRLIIWVGIVARPELAQNEHSRSVKAMLARFWDVHYVIP